MPGPVRTLLHGVADASQIEEACQLGLDGVAVEIGTGGGPGVVQPEQAVQLARHVPPLTACLAAVDGEDALPEGWQASVGRPEQPRPEGSKLHVVRAGHYEMSPREIAEDADLLWLRPRTDRDGAGSAFDYTLVERLARRRPVLLEVPDGAAGVEVAIRLGRPFGVVLGEGVWVQPGIVDLDRVEAALGVVARMNKAAFER